MGLWLSLLPLQYRVQEEIIKISISKSKDLVFFIFGVPLKITRIIKGKKGKKRTIYLIKDFGESKNMNKNNLLQNIIISFITLLTICTVSLCTFVACSGAEFEPVMTPGQHISNNLQHLTPHPETLQNSRIAYTLKITMYSEKGKEKEFLLYKEPAQKLK